MTDLLPVGTFRRCRYSGFRSDVDSNLVRLDASLDFASLGVLTTSTEETRRFNTEGSSALSLMALSSFFSAAVMAFFFARSASKCSKIGLNVVEVFFEIGEEVLDESRVFNVWLVFRREDDTIVFQSGPFLSAIALGAFLPFFAEAAGVALCDLVAARFAGAFLSGLSSSEDSSFLTPLVFFFGAALAFLRGTSSLSSGSSAFTVFFARMALACVAAFFSMSAFSLASFFVSGTSESSSSSPICCAVTFGGLRPVFLARGSSSESEAAFLDVLLRLLLPFIDDLRLVPLPLVAGGSTSISSTGPIRSETPGFSSPMLVSVSSILTRSLDLAGRGMAAESRY
ncbi:hypothetical protein KCU81_g261, partial [Aureobasidium melanogenum]